VSESIESLDAFEAGQVAPEEALVVTVDGFEGPLDLLLRLARDQKVDILKISVLRLADQYLEFIDRVRQVNLELAADYLVMAAWLAYLKSKLILEVMREASARLMARDRLERDVFQRGAPEPVKVIKLTTYKDTLYDLLTSYAAERVRKLGGKAYRPTMPPILKIEEARERLERMLGRLPSWSALVELLPFEWAGGLKRRSALASTLLACLELARDGKVEIRQISPFADIYVKDRGGEAAA
jgi:segregation and condensation protein A